ncbi:Six-hairpin glycosidase-like protein [Pseudocohnilembus persalinus]|uniref:glucan 1,4-alpha-glucosidase n=1 Tax=Pseudocohnilembus persalinus TaxID=266149 RepID=A0A0V0QBZ6_PSEPJ|nr:Six-hairpin glycosidase-like protein [Pseudocohnilembus persalinus]|eukprot:KRW99572.1 Six-hairpin glycosidase-like protein [Pseudocohnilembus persalinus]
MKYLILVILLLAQQTYSQRCSVEGSDRKDCGKVGSTQETCEKSGCCWNPSPNKDQQNSFFTQILAYFYGDEDDNYPYCFYPQNICEEYNFTPVGTEIFPDDWFDGMYDRYFDNINVLGNGGVCAAPGMGAETAGSYFYHWMRDGALTMRSFMELNDNDFSKIKYNMNKYVSWVENVQHKTDPNGINILIDPKFVIQTRTPFTGGWCRPQTDGPGLRSGTLIKYAQIQLKNQGSIDEDLYKAIYTDLNWLVGGWETFGCDLWEDIESDNFFWNRMSFYQSLTWGAELAENQGNSDSAQKYKDTAAQILPTILAHFNGSFIAESENRPWDGAVIHALSELNEGVFDLTGKEVAKTIDQLNNLFCTTFPINQIDDDNKIPGILYGRYKGDVYAGGNPWQLLTAVLAETFYKAAQDTLDKKVDKLEESEVKHWRKMLKIEEQFVSSNQLAKKLQNAGTAVMERLWHHTNADDYMISEQIDKFNGEQISALDLTWSYANILTVLKQYTHNESYLNQFE